MLSAALTSLLFVACGEGISSTSLVQRPESVQEVYANMLDAIDQPGKVLHTRMTYRTNSPISADSYSSELWLDPANGRARQAVEFDGRQTAGIIDGHGSYLVEDDGNSRAVEALTCRESDSPVLSTLVGCASYIEESQTRVGTTSSYRGRAVVTLVTDAESSGSDETFMFTDHLYVDANTWLPVALEREGTVDTGELRDFTTNVQYEHEWLDRSSLAGDFFELASIGYVEHDPADDLAQAFDVDVYWLGKEFDPGDGSLPALVLRGAAPYRAPGGLTMYRASLAYRSANDEFGPPMVGLQEWRRDEWDEWLAQSHGGNWWDADDADRTGYALPDRDIVVFRRPAEGWDGDRYLAWVYFADTMVMIMDFDSPSPYNSDAGIRALAEGLVPY